MASAVLANRNQPTWTQPPHLRAVAGAGGPKLIGKFPFYNPDPNPKFPKKRQFHTAPPILDDIAKSPAITRSGASEDASDFNKGGYVTFHIASYSKKELNELKRRLVMELNQIRQLKDRISSSNGRIKKPSIGNKRPFPCLSVSKDVKRGHPEFPQMMKKCGQILTKLMKPKLGIIFKTPVDVVGMQLHDYYDIIKYPMDLGTVKSKLGKNLYESPRGFARDVRLTFNNAMKYNPKAHEVYLLAEQFLAKFEEYYQPIKERVGEDEDEDVEELLEDQDELVQEVQASSWDLNPSLGDFHGQLDRVRKYQDLVENSEKIQAIGSPQNANPNPNPQQSMAQLPVRTPSPPTRKPTNLPKPKAKDPNKREMSLEEKHKLGLGLQSLPQEKMEQVLQIVRKRNGHLRQEGDEIELDIEAVDTETLWELDRFVTNYKKLVSKIKRQALMGLNNSATSVAASGGNKDAPGNGKMDVAATEAKKPKKGEEEDVDIGDEMPMTSFPPVEIQKDNGHASSSSGSSSSSSDDSSSSSDSDSGSSSGSDSEDSHS